jgi:hypothetical protein
MTNWRVGAHLSMGMDRTNTTETNPVSFARVLFNAFSKLRFPEGRSSPHLDSSDRDSHGWAQILFFAPRREASFAHQAEIKSEILSFPYALQRVLQGGVSTWFS